MKLFLAVLIFVFAETSIASPLPVEISNTDATHRFTLVPDAEGRIHLVDLNPVEQEIEPFFNAETDIVFLLTTLRNPTVGQRVFWNDMDSIRNSNYIRGNPTRFTVHGWYGDGDASVNWRVAERMFRLGDANMIGVDWSIGGNTINYITARNRVGAVASVIARFIDNLNEIDMLEFKDVHVIGHSLGGQIAGLTGKEVRRGKLQVVMACDPAGPLFSLSNPEGRVADTDAVHVEVIHTNGGNLGFREPIGHADFFPNFGRTQPGCSDLTGQCSHSRSTMFYAESITDNFTSTQCRSFEEIDNRICTPTGLTALMGGAFGNIGTRGNFYLTTNAESPFSQG